MSTPNPTMIQQKTTALLVEKTAGEATKQAVAFDADWLLGEEDEQDLLEYFLRLDPPQTRSKNAHETERERKEIQAHYLLGRLRRLTTQLLGKPKQADPAVQSEPTRAAISTLKAILDLIPLTGIGQILPYTAHHPYVHVMLELVDASPKLLAMYKTKIPLTKDGKRQALDPHQKELQLQLLQQMKDVIIQFKAKADSSKIKREAMHWEARAHRNFTSLKRYLNYLIDYYKRILVVRLDLHFKLDTPDIHDPIMAKKAFDRMLHNRHQKPSIFEHMVGYAWRLEHTPSRGCHFHVILIFDSQFVRQGISYGDMVGEYWRDIITDGKGTFWNCNRHAYRRYGLGIISHMDEEKRKIFIQDVAFYLTKVGDYYSLKKPDGHAKLKCFGKGEAPKLTEHTGAGRPRTVVIEE